MIIIIELTHSKTILEITIEIEPQPAIIMVIIIIVIIIIVFCDSSMAHGSSFRYKINTKLTYAHERLK